MTSRRERAVFLRPTEPGTLQPPLVSRSVTVGARPPPAVVTPVRPSRRERPQHEAVALPFTDANVSVGRARAAVKVVMAAANCAKGDVVTNLATHRDVLACATARGADVVVFPEMSLTGSVDPQCHPERLTTIRDAPVAALLDLTRGNPAAVVFGIAERDEGNAYITQC